MSKKKNFFILIDNTELVHRITLDNEMFRRFNGKTCNEETLRRWANRISDIPLNTSLKKISAAMKKDGWILFQNVPQE
jgi:hypothetical protein